MTNPERKAEADRILHEFGLLRELEKIVCPHIIGSYRMDMMAWNDLDIDIENENMSLDKLHSLSAFIINTFKPVWYEAKEEVNDEGKTVWFHGFETMITGEMWNVDLWFFDRKTIAAAEKYCDHIALCASRTQKDAIVNIKKELISRGLYTFDKYTSTDVYKAVLEKNIKDIDVFMDLPGRKA